MAPVETRRAAAAICRCVSLKAPPTLDRFVFLLLVGALLSAWATLQSEVRKPQRDVAGVDSKR